MGDPHWRALTWERTWADAYGKRNAVEGEVLVRLQPANVFALKNISD